MSLFGKPTQTENTLALQNMERWDVKSVQGSLTKEIGFYAERASTHNTHPHHR